MDKPLELVQATFEFDSEQSRNTGYELVLRLPTEAVGQMLSIQQIVRSLKLHRLEEVQKLSEALDSTIREACRWHSMCPLCGDHIVNTKETHDCLKGAD